MYKINLLKAMRDMVEYSLAKRRIASVNTLEEAVVIAFVSLPPGGKIVGPQGRIVLMRNDLPIGHSSSAEMLVIDHISGKDLFGYAWRKGKGICLQVGYQAKPGDWQGKW